MVFLGGRRMAGAILANAFVFHKNIAGMHDSIEPLPLVRGPGRSKIPL